MSNEFKLVPCRQGWGHAGHWCGPEFDCWLDPRDREQRNLDFESRKAIAAAGERLATSQPPAPGGQYDYRTDLACYFGLSYASWLTLPRVLMEAMPDDWQRRMAALLHEYDDAMINPPNLGTTVRMTVDGKMVPTPTWLVNYRHPDRQMIAQVFGRANPPDPAGSEQV